jgi:hypothetical protein
MPRAIRMPDGSYKCELCQIEEIQNRIVKQTPNSTRAKEIIVERNLKQQKELEFKRMDANLRKMVGRFEIYSSRNSISNR